MDTRLILVEGCPGSGNSSTAQFLCRQLQRAGHACRWYYDEELPHPATVPRGIARPKEFRVFGTAALRSWRDFVAKTRRSKEIVILESHVVQNIITPLVQAEVKPERVSKVVHRMAELCARLNPVLIHLHQPDYASTMRRLLDERGPRAEELYIRRSTTSRHARRRQLKGFDGLVEGWGAVCAVMEPLFDELDLPTLSIDTGACDWASYHGLIGEFLSIPVEPPLELSAEDLQPYVGTYTYTQDVAPRRAGGASRFGKLEVRRRVGGIPRQQPLHYKKDVEFTIELIKGELVMKGYGSLWPTTCLIPLKRDVFDLRSWPFQLVFERDKARAVVGATRKSETTTWQITGQRYPKLEE